MPLTRSFKQTIHTRVECDPTFAKALLTESATLFLSGEAEAARMILRDLVIATIGFDDLAARANLQGKTLHRMLSPKGNLRMNNFASIFREMQHRYGIRFDVRIVDDPRA